MFISETTVTVQRTATEKRFSKSQPLRGEGKASHYSARLMQPGWSGGAMVLGKLPGPGRPTIWMTIGQGPTALVVGAGGGIFTLLYLFSPLSPSL